MKNEGGRTAFEAILVTILIAILLLVAIERFLVSIHLVRETTLRVELSNIRRAIGLYLATKGRLPDSLKQLVEERVLVPKQEIPIILEWPYLQAMVVDEEGYLLDPFGNRFLYDPKTGGVKPGTKGYELW